MNRSGLLLGLFLSAGGAAWWALAPSAAPPEVAARAARAEAPGGLEIVGALVGVPATELGFVPPPQPPLVEAPLVTTAGAGPIEPAVEPPPPTPVIPAEAPPLDTPALAASAAGEAYLDEAGQPKPPDGPVAVEEGEVYLDAAGAPKVEPPSLPGPVYRDHAGRPKPPDWLDAMGDARYAEPVAVTDQAWVDPSAMPSNVELHDPVTGQVLPPDTPPPSTVERHVDGELPGARDAETYAAGPAVATTPPPEPPVDPVLYAETLAAPEPVPVWPGPGTDTRIAQ